MAKPQSTAKLVITSIILSLIVIAVFALIFLNFVVPSFQITEDQIYNVLIRIFPILIGLVLIQIGLMAGRRNEEDYADQVDKLPPNSYSRPLYVNDDPSELEKQDDTFNQEPRVVEKTVEVVKEVPVEVVKEVVKEVPVEVIKEVVKEVPVEVVKEVVKEVPVEVVKEVPVEVIKEVVKEVPVEVVKEVPVEVVKEVATSSATPEAETVLFNFTDALSDELENAKNDQYDVTLAFVKKGATTEAALNSAFGDNALIFEEAMDWALIFPFASKKETDAFFASAENTTGHISYSTATARNGNDSAEALIASARALL